MTATTYTSADMSARLWEASKREARFIVENYTTRDDHLALRVALSLGLATEYLVMSALASLDVALLADDKSAYSKVALSKVKAGAPIDVAQLRTVVYGTAVKLLRQHKQFVEPSDIESVMNIRNAAAHMAMVSQQGNEAGLTTMLSIVASLHKYLTAFKEDEYWGLDCLPVVRNLRDEHANKMKADYDARVLAAKSKFRVLNEGLSVAEREHVYSTLEQRLEEEGKALDPDIKTAKHFTCPACGRTASVVWDRSLLDDFQHSETYESETRGEAPEVTVSVGYDASSFKCLACGLELDRDRVAVLLNGDTYHPGEERYVLTENERRQYDEAFTD